MTVYNSTLKEIADDLDSTLREIANHLGEINNKLGDFLELSGLKLSCDHKIPRNYTAKATVDQQPIKDRRRVMESKVELKYVDIDPRNAVVFHPLDGKYHVSVQIQDGYEKCGVHDDQEAAVAAYVDGQKWLNNNVIDPKDVSVYIAEPEPKLKVKYRRI